MNHYELGTLAISLSSAGVAGWAAWVGGKSASVQRELEGRVHKLESRNVVATHFKGYSDVIASATLKVESARLPLAEAATECLTQIARVLDTCCAEGDGTWKTRHLYWNACEQIYEGFRGCLPWQNGDDLLSRYNEILCLDFRLGNTEKRSEHSTFAEIFSEAKKVDCAAEYTKNPNSNLEQKVFASPSFNLLKDELLMRMRGENWPQLFKSTVEKLVPWVEMFTRARPELLGACSMLDMEMKKNQFDVFKLEEVPDLLKAYRLTRTQANNLATLPLRLISFVTEDYYEKFFLFRRQPDCPLSELLYIGVVLFAVSHSSFWGFEKEECALRDVDYGQ